MDTYSHESILLVKVMEEFSFKKSVKFVSFDTIDV